MAFDNLLIEHDARVAVITINRPKVLNALNAATIDELQRALVDLKRDTGTRVVIITGAGEKAFVAGADINELAAQTPTSGRDLALAGQHVFDLAENLGKPVIAAINGYALGGGCELALACTLRLASDTASIGQPEIKLGLLPGYAGTQRLPRLIGKGKAMEMILTGAPVPAADAERIGLVNRVVPVDRLAAEVDALADRLARTPPEVMGPTKRMLNRAMDAAGFRLAVEAGLDLGAIINAADTPEQREWDEIVRRDGLRAALAWRDQRYDERLSERRGEG